MEALSNKQIDFAYYYHYIGEGKTYNFYHLHLTNELKQIKFMIYTLTNTIVRITLHAMISLCTVRCVNHHDGSPRAFRNTLLISKIKNGFNEGTTMPQRRSFYPKYDRIR